MAHSIEALAMPPRMTRRASPARVAQRRPSALLWLGIAVLVTALVALPRDAELPPIRGDLALAEPGRTPPAEPVWTNLAGAAPLFTIAGTRPAPSLTRYQARIQAETGAREDSASYGAFESGPYLRVDLRRSDAARPASHFVDLARRAAETGLALARLGRPEALAARFENLEVADASLAAIATSALRTCQSFRVRDDTLGVGLAGWLCDDAPAPNLRAQLACLIDRITLAPESQDLALRAMFAAASSRPQVCADEIAAAPVVQRPDDPGAATIRKRRRPTAVRTHRRAV